MSGRPVGNGNGGRGTNIGKNTLILGDTTVDRATVTCNPNAFSVPKFGFRGENAEDSISANVEVWLTAPEDGSVFSLDPELNGGTGKVVLFFDAKNWTNVLDESNTLYYNTDGTTHSIAGSDIGVANDRDADETMVVSVNILCQ